MRGAFRSYPVFILACLACLLSVGTVVKRHACAQSSDPQGANFSDFGRQAGPPPMRVGFVKRLDRNGDGRVSRAEFDGPPEHFDFLDRNRDGYLSEEERPGGGPLVARQDLQGRPDAPSKAQPDTEPVAESGLGGGLGADGQPAVFVRRLDRDGDGRVSQAEFDGPPDHFDFLDRNQDGYLSGDESPAFPPPANMPPVTRQEQANTASSQKQANSAPAPEAHSGAAAPPGAAEGPARYPWFNAFFISALAALVLALFWALQAARRFRKVRRAVEMLDPHLLAVSIDRNIMITEVTEALCRATGFRFKDLVGKPLMALGGHVADNPTAMQDMWNKVRQGTAWKGEVKLIRKNGSVLWADAVISPSRRKAEKTSGYTVFYQDVSKRKHFESLSMRDELTGLFNRRYFNEVAPLLLQKARSERLSYALCILDVDNFKAYNDTYGHPAGDQVLADIGRQLTAAFQRRDDMLFRLGGEEFGVILLMDNKNQAVETVDQALAAIRSLKIPHAKNPPGVVTASMGLRVVNPDENVDVETIYKDADRALYAAKQAGRDRFFVSKR